MMNTMLDKQDEVGYLARVESQEAYANDSFREEYEKYLDERDVEWLRLMDYANR